MVQMNPMVLMTSSEKLQRVYEFLTKVVGVEVDAKYIHPGQAHHSKVQPGAPPGTPELRDEGAPGERIGPERFELLLDCYSW